MGLQIIGHSYLRTYYYSKNYDGEPQSFKLPGGAALIAKILKIDVSANDALCHNECFDLSKYERDDKTEYYAVSRKLMVVNEKLNTNCTSQNNDSVILWDHGFDDINVSLIDGKDVLWASKEVLPDKLIFPKIAKKCFLMLDANVLRDNGAMISEAISWERTTLNLLWQLRNNDNISYLLEAPHILITFAEDGAVHIKTDNGVITSADLMLNDGKAEGTIRKETKGQLEDAFALMVASTGLQFTNVLNGNKLCMKPILDSGIKYVKTGFQLNIIEDFPFDAIPVDGMNEKVKPFPVKILSGGNTVPLDTWHIANDKDRKDIVEQATNYVLHGDEYIKGYPMLEIGKLKTVDRWEIEAFSNIRNMIEEYKNNDNEKPLSIAVFGSPGSGKSFGIKQIVESLFSEKEFDGEIFNVSQFTNFSELSVAFQWIRDIRLQEKLPLIVFDEFDSAGLDHKPLGWLKSFLAPMQDGEFYDSTGKHSLGKCIMVFTGSTVSTFKEFQKPENLEQFKEQKGPDFVSRIRGSIDIAGPNPRASDEKSYILRRALLLRSFCERDSRLKESVNNNRFIDVDVIFAMLHVPSYKHGTRSMETIIKQSIIKGKKLQASSLPIFSQLDSHVYTRAFADLLVLPVIKNSIEWQIAENIHADGCDQFIRCNAKLWTELDLEVQLAKFNQIKSYHDKLELIGCFMQPKGSTGQVIQSFAEDEILMMAKLEYERWREEKMYGWKYESGRNGIKKQDDCLMEWDNLDEEKRDLYKERVKAIPLILAKVNLAVYRK
ncbi:hypothetical protein [Candidatus Bathycorpusculum sp.]|uniref:hypothetical protein n=1 Tax=Candidatus Bathycorpusculum sp. TaxID=2994959 RepID=UPI00282B22A6|nr:hypothetical protein [Candidatus Termitimicrobium sp.]